MRNFEIKHPDYGKFGCLEQYAIRHLTQEKELPRRVDFQPNVLPTVRVGQKLPDKQHQEEVTKKSLDIVSKIFVDGVPLTDLYDWKMETSSFNPHGWGAPDWHYYMVGTRKKTPEPMTEYGSDDYQANMHFKVKHPIKLWMYTNDPQPTNSYYGSSQIYQSPTEEVTLKPDMEMLWLHGGNYMLPKRGSKFAYQVALFEPKSPFEKSYGNYPDLWYKSHVEKGDLELISRAVPQGVNFKLHGFKSTLGQSKLKEMVTEAVLAVMNKRI